MNTLEQERRIREAHALMDRAEAIINHILDSIEAGRFTKAA